MKSPFDHHGGQHVKKPYDDHHGDQIWNFNGGHHLVVSGGPVIQS